MARLFSIAIPFEGSEHTALVNIQQQGCDLVCFVRYTDEKLQYVLKGEELVFGLLEGLKKPTAFADMQAEVLVNDTITAITKHLTAA